MKNSTKRSISLALVFTLAMLTTPSFASDAGDMDKLNLPGTLNCTACDLSGEDLAQFSNFSGADLTSANLSEVVLRGANLSSAKLISVNFKKANLSRVNFTGADLQKANLQQAELDNAIWTNADLSGADLTDATGFGANTSGAKLCQTIMPNGTTNDSGC